MNKSPERDVKTDQSLVFNDYYNQYNKLMEENLRFLTPKGNIGYFAERKMAILRKLMTTTPEKILEYGCGIGNNLSFLKKQFPGVPIWGCDTSEKSLEVAEQKHPDIHFFLISQANNSNMKFDCILVSDVVHHIPASQREFYLEKILDYLTPSGKIVFFEHNPLNPLTRVLVSTCPFDENAELISLRSMRDLLKNKGLFVVKSRYCFYFPEFLQYFDRFEHMISWLPFGGKYYVLAAKNP